MKVKGGEEMFWRMLLEVGVAIFAVYGIACAARTLTEWIFPQKNLAMAVQIRTLEDAQDMDLLLYEARASVMRRGRSKLIVLISSSLMTGTVGEDDTLFDEYETMIERYGADCYLVEMD